MESPVRGRPRASDIERLALEHTLLLLDERGYDGLRMKDVATAAGIGLGAVYRRWSGKQELVTAALRADVGRHVVQPTDQPVEDLIAALLRISDAVPRGLGKLVAACLTEPTSELAVVAKEAKLGPMTQSLAEWLERVTGPAPDLLRRAENAIACIVWHAAVNGQPPDEARIRSEVVPVLGIHGTV